MGFSLGKLFGKPSGDAPGAPARVTVEARMASLPLKPDGKSQYLDPAFMIGGSGGFHREASTRAADGASVFGYRIELINKGRAPLLNFEAELKVEFVQAIREGDSMRSGKTVLEKPWPIDVPRLDPGKPFTVYVGPIPDRFVRIDFPAKGEAQRPGGGMAESVEIAFDRPMGIAVGPSNVPKRERS